MVNTTNKKQRSKKKMVGTVERPRLCVFRSTKHIYAQVIDDVEKKTLLSASTLDKELLESGDRLRKAEKAYKVGQEIAKLCLVQGIKKVIFDRNGFLYHGRISSLAEGAREGGLNF